MDGLIDIKKFSGQENFDWGKRTYTLPSDGKRVPIEPHITNAISFSKALKDDVTFVDKNNGVSLSICPTCKEKEIFAKYQKLAQPDGRGHEATVKSPLLKKTI